LAFDAALLEGRGVSLGGRELGSVTISAADEREAGAAAA
jgi:hypothetical protein